jgi:hypothetical protein
MAIQDTMGPIGTHHNGMSRQNMYWLIGAIVLVLALIGFSMSRNSSRSDVRNGTTTSDVNSNTTHMSDGAPAGTQ